MIELINICQSITQQHFWTIGMCLDGRLNDDSFHYHVWIKLEGCLLLVFIELKDQY